MTPEDMQRTMEFIVNQQAQLTATVGQLAAKVDRTADSVSALLAIAEIHDRELTQMREESRATDERLNALINTVERHISEGRNGQSDR